MQLITYSKKVAIKVLWTRRRQFLRTCRIVSQNPIFVARNLKKVNFLWKKHVFYSVYSFTQVECNFDKPAEKSTKIQRPSTQIPKLSIQTTSFLKLYPFLRNYFPTHKMQVWQLCGKKFAENL